MALKELIEVEIIERQTVKPSSPTPHHSTTLNLSAFDQMMPPIYLPIILYYSNTTATDETICQRLTHSLAKVLTHFYPFAGRLSKDNTVIQCNDDGAELVTARALCSLSPILQNPDPETLTSLLPTIIGEKEKDASSLPLLVVQANLFDCGGVAIGLKLSHKIADMSTCGALIKLWANTALEDNDDVVTSPSMLPKFDGASYFPPLDFSKLPPTPRSFPKVACTMKRFVFDASKLTALQSKLAGAVSSSAAIHRPTRVVAVSTLIWKCAMEASSSSKPSIIRPSTIRLTVDLRKRISPPELQNLAGNLVSHFLIESSSNEGQHLVAKFREGIKKVNETYAAAKPPFDSDDEYRRGKEYGNLVSRDVDRDHFNVTSFCRFPFYEADFGWGKPAWISIRNLGIKNLVVLLDKSDCKGIEAWVMMSPETMDRFESNAELLTYASVNPSVMA